MTHRERVLKTFDFEPVDRVPIDIMEAQIWPELADYYKQTYGLTSGEQILNHIDTDFRWIFLNYTGPKKIKPVEGLADDWNLTYSDALYKRPLSEANSVKDIENHKWPDPALWETPDFKAAREKWPEHALIYMPGWMPLFCGALNAFGMEEAMVKMYLEPDIFEAFISRHNEFYMEVLEKGLKAAQGYCDICWLGDDYASNVGLLVDPELWRKMIKPYQAKQVELAHKYGMKVLFHSCGSVKQILPDFIEIGINALLVFQTSAVGMDAETISKEYGGKLVFYGGVDVQKLLTLGSPEDVRREVRSNIEAFSKCGGYIVANSHHGLPDIKGENMDAMYDEAKKQL